MLSQLKAAIFTIIELPLEVHGVLDSDGDYITVGGSNFTENISPTGAVIFAEESSIQCHNYLLLRNNTATTIGVIYLHSSEFRVLDSDNVTFSNNLGYIITTLVIWTHKINYYIIIVAIFFMQSKGAVKVAT